MTHRHGFIAPADLTAKRNLRFSFDNHQPISASNQDTVTSALLTAGHLATSRSSKYRRLRGPFCLNGNCGTCLVRINGQPNIRACLTPAEDGMQVESQNQWSICGPFEITDMALAKGMDHHHFLVQPRWINQIMQRTARNLAGFGTLPSPSAINPLLESSECRYHDVDVLVVGSGFAGRTIATALEAAHVRVLTLDRRDQQDLSPCSTNPLPHNLLTKTGVFGLYPHDRWEHRQGLWAAATHPIASSPILHIIYPRHVVLATGSHEQQLLVPNNDIPGVFSARGLLHMLRRTHTQLTKACVVIGDCPESVRYAHELQAQHVTLAETKRIVGHSHVQAVETHDQRIDCSIVALAARPSPAYELAAQAGVRIQWQDSGFAVDCTTDGRCKLQPSNLSLPWTLWACGDIQGVMDAQTIADQSCKVATQILSALTKDPTHA